MERPELRQFGDLTREDFDRHAVWIGCHTTDYDETWHEDTDEETFRPWTGKLPADPTEGMLLVKATFELPDGSRHPGFVTPRRILATSGPSSPTSLSVVRPLDSGAGLLESQSRNDNLCTPHSEENRMKSFRCDSASPRSWLPGIPAARLTDSIGPSVIRLKSNSEPRPDAKGGSVIPVA